MQTTLEPHVSASTQAEIKTVVIPRWRWKTPVTMQVAFKGEDGFLLASDRKYLTKEPAIHFTGLDQPFGIRQSTKIAMCKKHNVAAVFSGNGVKDDFKLVADLCEHLDTFDAGKLSAEYDGILKAWGNGVFARYIGDKVQSHCDIPIASLLVVNPHSAMCPIGKLDIISNTKFTGADRVLVNGDVSNPATFWIHYSEAWKYESGFTVKQLIPLAALTIYSAAAINPYGIDGLEIKTWTDGEWSTVTNEQLKSLWEQYKSFMTPAIQALGMRMPWNRENGGSPEISELLI